MNFPTVNPDPRIQDFSSEDSSAFTEDPIGQGEIDSLLAHFGDLATVDPNFDFNKEVEDSPQPTNLTSVLDEVNETIETFEPGEVLVRANTLGSLSSAATAGEE